MKQKGRQEHVLIAVVLIFCAVLFCVTAIKQIQPQPITKGENPAQIAGFI